MKNRKGKQRMSYQSVDQLQKVLTEKVFHYAKDSKKAAGAPSAPLLKSSHSTHSNRGGLKETLRLRDHCQNSETTRSPTTSSIAFIRQPFDDGGVQSGYTSHHRKKIAKNQEFADLGITADSMKTHALLSNDLILRNSCTVCDCGETFINAYLDQFGRGRGQYSVVTLRRRPFAIFECKRVGVEEGMRKGPQTIEKAKQGAYVARTVSALHKIRLTDGSMGGLIQKRDGSFRHGDYYKLMAEIIASDDSELLSRFILTVGVVSNHGNWFTSENHNKELKVLAQSYDWLLFLTDAGIAQFIDELLFHPAKELTAAKEAFLASYTGKKGVNQFTKVQISLAADAALQSYFKSHMKAIEGWFNIIAPAGKQLVVLKDELDTLKSKRWQEIHT